MHETLLSEPCAVSERSVFFDENGVSEELTPAEYDRLLTIPGFEPVSGWYVTPEGEIDLDPVDAPEDESIPEHDPDATVYQQFKALGGDEQELFYRDLDLMPRLDLASDPRLSASESARLFDWENSGRKSKRCLNALDRRIQLQRGQQTAATVTDAMLKANFPREEER